MLSDFNKQRAADYATAHALSRSHTCCAWFVMKAMWAGGKPCPILPAADYRYILPSMGFKEIAKERYRPQTGDIVVFPRVGKHIWGHIAIWNGRQWVSDFRQKNLIVSKTYGTTKYRFFRYK